MGSFAMGMGSFTDGLKDFLSFVLRFFSVFMEFYHMGVSFLVVSCPSVNIWRWVSLSIECLMDNGL